MAGRGIDVIESGRTLEETGLVVKDVIMESSAVIIARKDNIKKVKDLYEVWLKIRSLGLPHRFTDGG